MTDAHSITRAQACFVVPRRLPLAVHLDEGGDLLAVFHTGDLCVCASLTELAAVMRDVQYPKTNDVRASR